MHYEFPLVFFTVLTQLAVGLALVNAWQEWRPAAPGSDADGKRPWQAAFAAAALGLLASLFHLADPLRAVTAMNGLATSWLSREGLVLGLFALLLLVRWRVRSRALSLLAALTGVLGLVMQGLTYAPVSMPAINNSFPFCLFALAALVLGTGFSRDKGITGLHRGALAVLLVLLLAVPCFWTSGNALMRATAVAWKASPFFWGGVALLLLGFGLSFRCRKPAARGLVLLAGILLTRMVFFGETLHTATNMGKPF